MISSSIRRCSQASRLKFCPDDLLRVTRPDVVWANRKPLKPHKTLVNGGWLIFSMINGVETMKNRWRSLLKWCLESGRLWTTYSWGVNMVVFTIVNHQKWWKNRVLSLKNWGCLINITRELVQTSITEWSFKHQYVTMLGDKHQGDPSIWPAQQPRVAQISSPYLWSSSTMVWLVVAIRNGDMQYPAKTYFLAGCLGLEKKV